LDTKILKLWPKLVDHYTSPIFQNSMKQMVKGGAMPAISFKLFDDIEIKLPTMESQHNTVRRVEELFAFADRIEQKANAAFERVNNLTQAILAKAFRGELTADWRAANPDLISGENSAEALLMKIKAEREALSSKKKPKKKTAARKKA
ncbi:MAG: restriction endonuclease subunit S, partial [Pseudoalteromonas prydzensis]|uniref:restriction endonuclease subunit S n=1 Tax=Pseudoalteromonas prydzensis TaxID=182141 RepID=UPI003F9780B8